MAPKGTAVVGTGFIGPVHIEALRRLGREVVGVLGSSAEKSKAAANALGLKRGYSSLEDLLADEEVSIVHLTSPNRHHFAQCRQALAAGKHVLCEKPLAMSTEESVELVRLAKESDRICAVCYNVRFYPLNPHARAMVRQGDLGTLFHVTGSYVQDWLLYDTDFSWRVMAEEGGALRAVADIGTHWMDLITSITGQDIVSVCADLSTMHKTRQRPRGSVETFSGKSSAPVETEPVEITTEDYGSILFRTSEGASGCLTVSQVSAGRKNQLRYEIAGSKSALAWDSERPNELWQGFRDQPNHAILRDPSLMDESVAPFANYPGGHNEGFPDTFKQLFRAVYDYIEAGDYSKERPFPTFEEGHKEVALCEAILKSDRERKWVEV